MARPKGSPPPSKPGSLPPESRFKWLEWREVQESAGILPTFCDLCWKLLTPQEKSACPCKEIKL